MVLRAVELAGPPRCVGCGRPSAMLCRSCARALRPAAPRSGPPPVERVVAALDYRDPARALVLALKLRARRAAAEPLVDELARAVARTGLAGEVVTWVPGRTRDVRKRGFDHAEVIARGLAARLGLPVVSLLARSRPRPDQSGLTAAQRWTNLEDAFRARPCSAPTVLVDDLITTGATAGACARALIAAGAPRVELVAACSTEGPDRT